MLKESLHIYTLDSSGNKTPFPSAQSPSILSEWTYTAERMASAPTITGTLMHKLCLDDLWSKKEFVVLNGERYYVNQVPTSSKDTDDVRYKHEITFVSERIVLENVFFFDVVTANTDEQYEDRYRSNGTKFSFYGTLHELVSRLNDSLIYSSLYSPSTGVGYHIVIDEGISVTDEKEISLENVYFATAMQEIYNQFGIPYYWKGKTCHVGYNDNSIATPFEYGQGKGLLSITKTNADYRIINRITGTGSSDNIPYYYPNKSADRSDPANGGVWITPTGNLMPPIYRESNGGERFYNALNNTYSNPNGGYYSFNNPYTSGNPMEGIAEFEDIKPSIKGMANAAGQLLGEIAAVAFDSDDSDEVDDNGDYVHSYFYVKLHVFNGIYGFNLFKQATAEGGMTFNMTSGNCAGCAFEVGVSEPRQVNGHYEFDNPVQVDSAGNIVSGSYSDKVDFGNIQERQQDTSVYEVWVALKKEIDTFGVVMPNVTNNYKPKDGDTFVITNILMPDVYITNAENELKAALIKYMSENNDEKFTFTLTFSRIYLQRHPEIASMLDENARLIVRYNDHDYTLYVSSFSCKAADDILNEITVEVTDVFTIGQSSLRDKIAEVAQSMMSGNSASQDILALGQKYFLSKRQNDTAQGVITFLRGLLSDNIESQSFASGPFGTGFLIKRDPTTGKSYIEADEIYIRLKAYFETLEIKHLSHVGGRVVLSPAGMECVKVELADAEYEEVYDSTGEQVYDLDKDAVFAPKGGGQQVYRCYFKQKDDEKEIINEFAVGDLAQCREFNVKAGISHQVGNQYYWRRVENVGEDFIDLSITNCDTGSMEPKAGDTIVTIGNDTDPARQHVVFLSSYDDDAPCIKLYSGINTYSMLNKEVTVISPNADKNVFTGKLVIKPGSEGFGNLTDAPDMDEINQNIQNAKNDAANAQQAATNVQGSVNELNTYIDGAFADGIISEAEAKAIEKYINTVETEKKSADSTYNKLYTNAYLDGSAKVQLTNAHSVMNSAIVALTSSINTAIADGKTTIAEKNDVDAKFATFNTACASFYDAVEAANEAIQTKLKSYSDNAQKAADEANNNASQAMESATNAKNAVTELNTYVDGAFADGIISEAEAKAIEKYINTVNQTKKEADSTYNVLYNNSYLTGLYKSMLYTQKGSFDTATTNLINSINTAIADGKTTIAEKNDVDAKFATFNTSYANLATAIENANKAIQSKIKQDAVDAATQAANSKIGTVTQEAKDDIAKKLGYTNYEQLEQFASRGETVIKGGSINTNLINANLIVTSALIASAIRTNTLNVNDNFKVYTDGSVDINGIMRSFGKNTEAVLSDGYLLISYNGVDVMRIAVDENTGLPEITMRYNNLSFSVSPSAMSFGLGNSKYLRIDPSIIGEGIIKKMETGQLYIADDAISLINIYVKASPTDGGTTSPKPGPWVVEKGSMTQVTATPYDGYEFSRWSDGGLQSHAVYWSTEGQTLTAYFTKKTATMYTVTLQASPTSGGTVSGGGAYESGTVRTVSATPATGYRFVRWSDGGYQSHSVTWDMNKTLTAYFEKYNVTNEEIFQGTELTSSTYTSTVDAGGTGTVSVSTGSGSIKAVYSGNSDWSSHAVWILFNKGYLGSKLQQGHRYRLTINVKTSTGTALVIAGIGSVDSSGNLNDITNMENLIYGEQAGTTAKTFTLELTASRDSISGDALCMAFIPQVSSQTVTVTSVSLKEI